MILPPVDSQNQPNYFSKDVNKESYTSGQRSLGKEDLSKSKGEEVSPILKKEKLPEVQVENRSASTWFLEHQQGRSSSNDKLLMESTGSDQVEWQDKSREKESQLVEKEIMGA